MECVGTILKIIYKSDRTFKEITGMMDKAEHKQSTSSFDRQGGQLVVTPRKHAIQQTPAHKNRMEAYSISKRKHSQRAYQPTRRNTNRYTIDFRL
jgi:hypothetical protein